MATKAASGVPTDHLTRDEAWRRVEKIQDDQRKDRTRLNPFVILERLGVCPQGMADPVYALVEEEMMCETYHAPPVAGGIEDWPALKYDAFAVIRQTHNKIRAERIEAKTKG